MTVTSSTNSASYAGDGVSTTFTVPFRFLEDSHLLVVLVDADGTEHTQVLNTDYTASGAGDATGGVTFSAAPASGRTVQIFRNVPITQEKDYVAGDKFPAESHENALDKLTMIAQQQGEKVGRSWLAPYGETAGTITAGAEGTVPKYDAEGNQIEGPSAAEIESAEGYAEAAEAALADFNERYLGAFADDTAATAAAGGAPITGALYFNTGDGKLKAWDGTGWQATDTALNDGDVTTPKLADEAVTDPKVAKSFKAKIMGIAADRTALAGMDGTAYVAVDLMEAGRKGLFYWDASDLSAKVTLDPDQGVYVPPTGDTTGVSGAWVRQFDGDLWLNWFGFSEAETALNNVLIFNRVILFAQTPRRTIAIPAGEFDISVIGSASENNGIKLVSDTHIRGQGPRKSALNLIGASTATNLNNFTGGSGVGRNYTPGVANIAMSNVLLEDFAVTMNHPSDSVAPSVAQQIGIDFRHISRSTIRRCYLGNYSPISGSKGIANEFLVQGYAIAVGGSSGAAVDYAHQELNIIEENTIVGAKYGVAMEIVGPYTGAAYQTTIRRNDIQMCQRLIVQGGSGGAANIIAGNTLQNLVKPNGDASITIGIWINGYGNRVEMDYGEFGADCQHMIRLEASSARNWVSISATNGATGGIVDGIQDSGTNNVIWFFANTAGAGAWNGNGAPGRRVNKVSTTMT